MNQGVASVMILVSIPVIAAVAVILIGEAWSDIAFHVKRRRWRRDRDDLKWSANRNDP